MVYFLSGAPTNCSGIEGSLYQDLNLTVQVCDAVYSVLHDRKIILKIGFASEKVLTSLVRETSDKVHGWAAINTISTVGNHRGEHDEEPAFGRTEDGKPRSAGLSGSPILRCGIKTVQRLRAILKRENLSDHMIIGIGGVTSPADVLSYQRAGAHAVQATTSFFVDSFFAVKVRDHLAREWRSSSAAKNDQRRAALKSAMTAAGELMDEFPGNDGMRLAVEQAIISAYVRWEGDYRTSRAAGPHRGLAVPSASEFKRQAKGLMRPA